MDGGIAEIIVAVITVGVPSIVSAVFGALNHRQGRMNSAKQSILVMILDDQFHYEQFGKLPINQSRVAYEYRVYTKSGGNSDVTERYEEYKQWLDTIERRTSKYKSSHSS